MDRARTKAVNSGELMTQENVRLPVGLKNSVRRLAKLQGVTLQTMYARVVALGVGGVALELKLQGRQEPASDSYLE